MPYRVRDRLHGCNHLNTEPCAYCDMMRERRKTDPIKCPGLMPDFGNPTFEHAFDPWDTPHPVSSREELRELCNRQGVTSVYLRESSLWKSGETRWV